MLGGLSAIMKVFNRKQKEQTIKLFGMPFFLSIRQSQNIRKR